MHAPDAPGKAINVASGHTIRILDLARDLAGALGSALAPEVTGEYRAGDVRHWFADPTLARDVLGFHAERRLADELPALAGWVARQTVEERGDQALADLRERGLVV